MGSSMHRGRSLDYCSHFFSADCGIGIHQVQFPFFGTCNSRERPVYDAPFKSLGANWNSLPPSFVGQVVPCGNSEQTRNISRNPLQESTPRKKPSTRLWAAALNCSNWSSNSQQFRLRSIFPSGMIRCVLTCTSSIAFTSVEHLVRWLAYLSTVSLTMAKTVVTSAFSSSAAELGPFSYSLLRAQSPKTGLKEPRVQETPV